jgi:hypothetical protein
MRRASGVTILVVLLMAGPASASVSGAVSAQLTAAKVGGSPVRAPKVSTPVGLSVGVSGLSGFTGLPTSVQLQLQRGFTSTVLKALSARCTSSQATAQDCPVKSQVGTGSMIFSLSGLTLTMPIGLFAGAPSQAGDIATIYFDAKVALGASSIPLSIPARLFTPKGGGVELLADLNVPASLESIAAASTVQSLKLSTGVSRSVTKTVTGKRKHKTTYSLLTTPSKCSGKWTGSAALVFANGTFDQAFSAACHKSSKKK